MWITNLLWLIRFNFLMRIWFAQTALILYILWLWILHSFWSSNRVALAWIINQLWLIFVIIQLLLILYFLRLWILHSFLLSCLANLLVTNPKLQRLYYTFFCHLLNLMAFCLWLHRSKLQRLFNIILHISFTDWDCFIFVACLFKSWLPVFSCRDCITFRFFARLIFCHSLLGRGSGLLHHPLA